MTASASHYLLPEGNVQIAFSGGRTSAYMLHQILEANGDLPARVQVTFQNTTKERPEGLDFVAECARRWSVTVTWLEKVPTRPMTEAEYAMVEKHFGTIYAQRLADWWARSHSKTGFQVVSHNSAARHGEAFVALILSRKYLPNQASRFCTVELKVRTAKRYLRSLGWDYWTNCVGLRADEPRRIKPEGVRFKDRWTVWQPLNNAGVGKHHVSAFWERQPFDLCLPNVNGNCWLGNCDGCFLKSEASIAAFTREYPDDALWWELMEALASDLTTGRAAHWSKRYTRAEMRDFMDRQGDAFDTLVKVGALCQASDGECTG